MIPAGLMTPRRVSMYPRIVLIVIGLTIALNIAGSTGWRGAGGQLLFHDFIIFYSAGALFHAAPHSLYDFDAQLSLQRSLIAPTQMDGTGPFSHPPYVAPLFEPLTALPLVPALIVWTILGCAALAGAIVLAHRLLRREPWLIAMPMRTFAVIALSLAPVLFGLYSGQMHSFVLLGSLAVIVFVLDDKPWQAGAIAGLLAIKPQVALAFLILFVARRNVKACVASAVAFAGLNALFVSRVGIETAVSLYGAYVHTTRALVMLPFDAGFPRYLLTTPYGLMSGLVGREHQATILIIANVAAAAAVLWFLLDASRSRYASEDGLRVLLGRTLLLPSLVTPYLMLYDAAPLMLSCFLIIPATLPRYALTLSGMVYAGLWIYPPLSAAIGIPLGALLPIGLYFGAMRMAPSSRMTSPLSISFSKM
jgi:glycosyl transferase family 87